MWIYNIHMCIYNTNILFSFCSYWQKGRGPRDGWGAEEEKMKRAEMWNVRVPTLHVIVYCKCVLIKFVLKRERPLGNKRAQDGPEPWCWLALRCCGFANSPVLLVAWGRAPRPWTQEEMRDGSWAASFWCLQTFGTHPPPLLALWGVALRGERQRPQAGQAGSDAACRPLTLLRLWGRLVAWFQFPHLWNGNMQFYLPQRGVGYVSKSWHGWASRKFSDLCYVVSAV